MIDATSFDEKSEQMNNTFNVIFVEEYLLKVSRASLDAAGIFTIGYFGLSNFGIMSELKVFLLIYLVALVVLSFITRFVIVPILEWDVLKDSNLQQVKAIEEKSNNKE